jgi:hypothetical protein
MGRQSEAWTCDVRALSGVSEEVAREAMRLAIHEASYEDLVSSFVRMANNASF